MKRIAVFTIALTCLVGAADFVHAATATSTLTVSATVPEACTISTNSVLSFGVLPSFPSFSNASGDVTVNCAPGTAWTVTLNRGAAPVGTTRAMLLGGVSVVNYELYKDAGLTQVWGDNGFAATYPFGTGVVGNAAGMPQTTVIFGRAQAIASAPPGNYTDIVVATVNF